LSLPDEGYSRNVFLLYLFLVVVSQGSLLFLQCIIFFFQWLRLDELFEQERNIRVAMSNRVGVLGLMLHQTIDHDPLNPIKVPTMK
jgi:hypothetical protein